MGNSSSMQNIDVSNVIAQKSINVNREMNEQMREFDSYVEKLASEIYKQIKRYNFQKISSNKISMWFRFASMFRIYPKPSDISKILRSRNYDVISNRSNGGYTDVNAYALRKLNTIFAGKMEIQYVNLQYTEAICDQGWFVDATIKILGDENNN